MIRVLVLLLLLLPRTALSEVIVNSDVSIDKVSRHYLLSVFSMRARTWPDGKAVRVFILPPYQPPHKKFVKQELGLFPYQLIKIWDRAVFSGAGQSPIVVANHREMLERVKSTAGAIGYIQDPKFQGGDDVKVLQVD